MSIETIVGLVLALLALGYLLYALLRPEDLG
jgi:K+-transporting ATPase KdpF subunit